MNEMKHREGQLSHENTQLKLDLKDKQRKLHMQEEEDVKVRERKVRS